MVAAPNDVIGFHCELRGKQRQCSCGCEFTVRISRENGVENRKTKAAGRIFEIRGVLKKSKKFGEIPYFDPVLSKIVIFPRILAVFRPFRD